MLKQLWGFWCGEPAAARRARPSSRPRPLRLTVETLEDRAVPASFTAASVADLIAGINAANLTAEADTISLAPGKTFTLIAVNNTDHGATGLPVIAAAGGSLTIVGNGDVIERRTTAGTPSFRLFDVAAGASLTLENLTLQGGLSEGPGGGKGGAIYNEGNLNMLGATVRANTVKGGTSSLGGGIYSAGSLTLENTTIKTNKALGLQGLDSPGRNARGGNGGCAYGGGVYISGGTASLTDVTLSGNKAIGGDGGKGSAGSHSSDPTSGGAGGDGAGGGLYAAGGSVTLRDTKVTGNAATGGKGGKKGANYDFLVNGLPGSGQGGGLYLGPDATVFLDTFTVNHVKNNSASTSDPNIHGSYSPAP